MPYSYRAGTLFFSSKFLSLTNLFFKTFQPDYSDADMNRDSMCTFLYYLRQLANLESLFDAEENEKQNSKEPLEFLEPQDSGLFTNLKRDANKIRLYKKAEDDANVKPLNSNSWPYIRSGREVNKASSNQLRLYKRGIRLYRKRGIRLY